MMTTYVKGDSRLIKDLNVAVILEIVSDAGEISRTEIARRSKLSPPAVTVIINDLLEKGLILEVGKAPSTGGRRRRLISLNPDGRYFIGVDIGATKIHGGLLDFTGELLCNLETPTDSQIPTKEVVISVIENLMSKSKVPRKKILGIGLGIPGVVNPENRIATFSPGVGWENRDIGGEIYEAVGIPVWVDNEANTKVHGEQWKGALKDINNGVCLTIGNGIGMGLLLNQRVYHGKRGASGEIGYWLLNFGESIQRNPGYGHLESFAAGSGIVQRTKDYLGANQQVTSSLRGMELSAKAVFEAAQNNDPVGVKIIEETTRMLGIAIANLSSLLDVERVVLSGGITRAGSILLDPIKEIVEALAPYPPEIVISELQETAGVLGAAHGFIVQDQTYINFNKTEF